MKQYYNTIDNWLSDEDFDGVCPWDVEIKVVPQASRAGLRLVNQKLNTLLKSTECNTDPKMLEFKPNESMALYRSRMRSMDSQQRQLLKCTPVRQYCDFKISKELLMTKNNTVFPKQTLPRNFLQSHRRKVQPMKRFGSQELSTALAVQIHKIEEQVKQTRSQLLGAKRLSDPKYQSRRYANII